MGLRGQVQSVVTAIHQMDPASVGLLSSGGGVFAVAALAGEHNDALMVLAVGAMLAGMIEWSLARRFRSHERNEDVARVALVAAVTSDFTKQVEAVKTELARAQTAFDGLAASYDTNTRSLADARRNFLQVASDLAKQIEEVRARVVSAPPHL